jgi:integrase
MVAEGSFSVEKWLSRLAPSTARMNRHELGYFMKWLKSNGGHFSDYTPDMLVEYQKKAADGHQYDILDFVQSWVQTLKGRYETKRHRYNAVRSFFAHNRAHLPPDKSFKIRSDIPPVRAMLSAEDVRNIVLSCNVMYRAVFLCLLMGGMGQEEFIWWSNNGLDKLKKDLKREKDIIRIDLPGRKSSRNRHGYYTMMGGDALVALKNWMLERSTLVMEKDIKCMSIFLNQFGRPLNKPSLYTYWYRHLRKLNLVVDIEMQGNRTGKNPHELRDTFRTLWEKSGAATSVAEFAMGHVVDELGYNKAHHDEAWVRKEFRKALPYLNILSSTRAYGQVSEDRVAELEAQLKALQELQKRQWEEFQRLLMLNGDKNI